MNSIPRVYLNKGDYPCDGGGFTVNANIISSRLDYCWRIHIHHHHPTTFEVLPCLRYCNLVKFEHRQSTAVWTKNNLNIEHEV